MTNRRIRDAIHGLITFDLEDPVDQIAWNVIDTPEFQRLRRVRQLGVSELVFPGATHTRFAHSVGVFHNARRLMKVIEREEGDNLDRRREAITLLAALVHDLGHGPFSHAFEMAREKIALLRGQEGIEKHETFSARMIRNHEGKVAPELVHPEFGDLSEEIAALIQADDPVDIYHAVVSSSFDADRLDYLVRDRHMTGVEAGGIDQDWLIDNLQKCTIQESQDDDDPRPVPTFAFKSKGRQAAEDFLLARYRLYSQLYLHKTTRGFEQIITAILLHIARHCDKPEDIGLNDGNKLVAFFRQGGDTLENYSLLDDGTVWSTAKRLSEAGDDRGRMLSNRLLLRERPRVLDVTAAFIDNPAALADAENRLDIALKNKMDDSVFKDRAPNHVYGRLSGEAAKAHKMIRVLNGAGVPLEILEFPDTILSNKWLTEKKHVVRYYFLDLEDRTEAERIMLGR